MSSDIDLSVCVTVRNRSLWQTEHGVLTLFPNAVNALRCACLNCDVKIELVVSDWGSDDWPLAEWLPGYCGRMPYRVIRLEGVFSRGVGLNRAEKVAASDNLLFTDADVLLSQVGLEESLQFCREGNAFFPVIWCAPEPGKEKGRLAAGAGICSMKRKIYREAGGFPEWRSWGGEDIALYNAVRALDDCRVIRKHSKEFVHQWHPLDRVAPYERLPHQDWREFNGI